MQRLSRFEVLIALASAALVVAGALAGVAEALGAHPVWVRQTGIIGGVGGAVVYLLLRRAGLAAGTLVKIAAVAFLASAVAAHFGKDLFVTSFAENATAGRFWYFGWFVLSGSVAAFLAAMIARFR